MIISRKPLISRWPKKIWMIWMWCWALKELINLLKIERKFDDLQKDMP